MNDEVKLILTKLKIVSEEKENGAYICDKKHSKLLLSYIEQLEEDNEYLKRLCETQNNREYRSKFLKEFQEEHGKNVFPDYDEIYKRYDKLKKQKDDVVELCNKSIKSINDRLAWIDTSLPYPNEYQRIRLKAFRTKCKEILRLLGECNE